MLLPVPHLQMTVVERNNAAMEFELLSDLGIERTHQKPMGQG